MRISTEQRRPAHLAPSDDPSGGPPRPQSFDPTRFPVRAQGRTRAGRCPVIVSERVPPLESLPRTRRLVSAERVSSNFEYGDDGSKRQTPPTDSCGDEGHLESLLPRAQSAENPLYRSSPCDQDEAHDLAKYRISWLCRGAPTYRAADRLDLERFVVEVLCFVGFAQQLAAAGLAVLRQ